MDLMKKRQILVVDDDKLLRNLLSKYLTKNDCLVICAEDAAAAEAYLDRFQFDLMIVDVMMPGEDGVSFSKRMKNAHADMPILMLTALSETENRITGLEAGVDDYLPKPFEPKELMLRIQAILRRTLPNKNSAQQIGKYVYSPDQRRLHPNDGDVVNLTESENELLKILHQSLNQTVDRYELADRMGLDASERSIDVQITRLRKKIETDPKNPRHLQTVRGKGYVLRG